MQQFKSSQFTVMATLAASTLVLAAFFLHIWLSREDELDSGKNQLLHLSELIAEHTSRSFEGVDILLRELATDLSKAPNWEEWPPEQGFEYLSTRHTRSLPQVRDLIIFDNRGTQRFISTQFPTPKINVKDRPYFATLERGADFAMYGPYLGRNSGRYTYALARRLKDPEHNFKGAVFAALEPAYFQEFCWSIRLSDEFDAVLVNTQGRIVASCRPTDLSQQAPLVGANASDVLADGALRDISLTSGVVSHQGWLLTESPVNGFPDLRILSMIPEQTLLQNWHRRVRDYSVLALLTLTILLFGGWHIRRNSWKLQALNGELLSGREFLEEKIHEATLRLETQKEEAERANAAKSRFLAAASHDLRQPLHALALFASDLQRQVRLGKTEQLPQLGTQIQASTEVLSELLDSLLDLSRLDVAGITPLVRSFPVDEVLSRLATTFDRAAIAKGLRLHFRTGGLWICSDATLLERLLANLVSNSIRYTEKGGVLVSARKRGAFVLIEVRDTGIGIPLEHQQAIFVEFYQINNAARESHKGLGLGLSIVDRLARALSIEIDLRSLPGRGTLFSLRLPLGEPVQPLHKPAIRTTQAKQAIAISTVGHSTELDNAINLLQEWGYPVRSGYNHENPPRIIIATTEGVPAVRHKFSSTPLIVLAHEDDILPDSTHRLSLPLRPARLRALLRRLEESISE